MIGTTFGRAHRIGSTLVALGLALGLAGCGDKGGGAGAKGAEAKKEIDADPIALLPSGALVVANVDTKAFLASPSVGPQIAQLVERYATLPEEAGFKASRDVDFSNLIQVLVTTAKDALTVPANAVQRGPTGLFVYVVDAGSKAVVRPVETTETFGDHVIVVSADLKEGDMVVTTGQSRLQPGSKVSVHGDKGADAKAEGKAAEKPDAKGGER